MRTFTNNNKMKKKKEIKSGSPGNINSFILFSNEPGQAKARTQKNGALRYVHSLWVVG
jgi:hypothetical protein